MALLDLQPVDLSDGDRIHPHTLIKVIVKSDKDLPEEDSTTQVELNFRKIYKSTQIGLAPARFHLVDHAHLLGNSDDGPRPVGGPIIRTIHKCDEETALTLEYDLDEEDQVWLDEENKKRDERRRKKIQPGVFEAAMDRLEKETYFKTTSTAHDITSMDGSEGLDDDCCICGSGEVENLNQIIYCDMCNIAVHQDCYGVPYIPEGQWLCRKCKLSPMEPVKCELCPLRDGAFKQTSDGKWAHVTCAIWLNEVHFGNTAFLEPIEGVANSLRRRQKLRCLVCKVKVGACLQCSKGSCVKSFHVTCAMQAKLQMVVSTQEDPKAPEGVSVKRFVYCHIHGSVSVGENEFAKNKNRAIEAIRRARRKMVNNSVLPTVAPVPFVDLEAKNRIEEKIGESIDEIMSYWFYKRKKRCGLPLIRRLQAKKKSFTPRLLTPRAEMLRAGRIMAEKLRLLVDLFKKREHIYLEQVAATRAITMAAFQPLDDTFVQFINSLYACDTLKFFHTDPMQQGLTDYNSKIKKPMDLTTMRNNAKKGMYKNEKELKEHIDLIFTNCDTYNKLNAEVRQYGAEVKEKMSKAFHDMVDYLKFVNSWSKEFGICGEESVGKMEVTEKEEPMDEIEMAESKTPSTTTREETNRRKRKATEEPKKEEEEKVEMIETPAVKREKRMRERDKEKKKEINQPTLTSVFASSIQTPSTLTPRRCSIDTINPRLDSNSNKATRRLTRGQTQSSFSSYRDIDNVMSPEVGATSCDSAVESDVETSRPPLRPYSSLSDPYLLQHGDLVKVDSGTRKFAGQIMGLTEAMIEDPRTGKLLSSMKEIEPNHVIVKTFTNNSINRYNTSCVFPLNIDSDLCEGIDEAKKHWKLICSK
ncbi:hypothetical protein PFISCL1PPCAC_14678 [Pristionchus fissidentatus]|uniref:Uncharacterized protein n=1 Tax=Pristionchus fissidentatus TaxID=1538716 RepID=A0AAV5VV50_9BILA|nr:hypothetical protein PFISCL1PPCAC_14678 [Pristionchus fissidentatus]